VGALTMHIRTFRSLWVTAVDGDVVTACSRTWQFAPPCVLHQLDAFLSAPRYVSSQMRHRVLLFPKLPPGAGIAFCHCQ
jgi:hypothetical protein